MNVMNTLLINRPGAGQRGIALIMGLIFLVVLTLLGMAAMRTTLLEERMANNTRDRDLAFQSAEVALRQAEIVLTGATLPPFAAGTAYTPRIANGTLTTYWQTTHDWAAQSVTTWQPQGVSAAPQYVVEHVADHLGGGGGLGIGALADEGVYRITARGFGSSTNTVVILQAVFQR